MIIHIRIYLIIGKVVQRSSTPTILFWQKSELSMKTFASVVWQKHTKMTAVHVTASVLPLPPRPAPSIGLKWAEHAARKDYLCILGQQQRTHLVAGISPLLDVADDPKQRGCSEGCGRRGAQPGQEQMLPREERPVPPASPAQAAQLSSAFLPGTLKGTVTST